MISVQGNKNNQSESGLWSKGLIHDFYAVS